MGSIITGGSNYRRLTNEQREFYDIISVRAMSANVGAPYLRSQIVSLYPVAVENIPGFTFAIDKRGRMYINFEEVMKKPVAWGAGGIVHECWHLLLEHFNRRQPEHNIEDFWAWATDMEINQNLPEESKKVMQNEIYFPSSFNFPDGLTAEDYYNLLLEEAKKQQGGGGKGDPDEDEDSDGEGGEGSGDGSEGEGSEGNGNGKGKSKSGNGKGTGTERGKSGFNKPFDSKMDDCGSAQHGNSDPNEASKADAPERSEMDHQYTRNEVAKSIQRAEANSKNNSQRGTGIGTVPAFASQWAKEILTPPKVRWQSVLRGEYAQQQRRAKMGRTHSNPRRPGRVQPVDDIMFPKRKAHRINVGIAFDSSGSNFDDLKYVLGEVHEIIRRGGVDAVFAFSVDADVKDVKRIRRITEVEFKGGGGTDMRVAFTKLAEMKVDVGIILTDCETPWPDAPLETKTKFIVAGMISRESARQSFESMPDFLRKVEIDLTKDSKK